MHPSTQTYPEDEGMYLCLICGLATLLCVCVCARTHVCE